MGDRIEFSPAFKEYTIWRVATEEREAYSYTVSEWDMFKVQGELNLSGDEFTHVILNDESLDSLLRPIRRRAAIEHSRSKGEQMSSENEIEMDDEQKIRQLSNQRDLIFKHALDVEAEICLLGGIPSQGEAMAHAREFLPEALEAFLEGE